MRCLLFFKRGLYLGDAVAHSNSDQQKNDYEVNSNSYLRRQVERQQQQQQHSYPPSYNSSHPYHPASQQGGVDRQGSNSSDFLPPSSAGSAAASSNSSPSSYSHHQHQPAPHTTYNSSSSHTDSNVAAPNKHNTPMPPRVRNYKVKCILHHPLIVQKALFRGRSTTKFLCKLYKISDLFFIPPFCSRSSKIPAQLTLLLTIHIRIHISFTTGAAPITAAAAVSNTE